MKRNPVLPYALIAVLGLTLMIVISFVGLNQMDQAKEGHGSEENQQNEEEAASGDPEKIYSQNCVSCHGSDLSGGMGPNLQEIGSKLSKEELVDTITNGVEGTAMPSFQGKLQKGQIDSLATWLSEKK